MFVSHPEYAFTFPAVLDRPDTQHWRMVELSIHAPWFLLSLEIVTPDDPEDRIVRTVCIAWDYDLAELVREIEPAQVRGLVCLMPAWQSPSGQWSSVEVREIWLHRSSGGQHLVFIDAVGGQFDCGMVPKHAGPVQTEMLLQVPPRKLPVRSDTRTASRRTRRNRIAKAEA